MSFITPPFDARVNVSWGPSDVALGVATVLGTFALALAGVSLFFDEPTPVGVVLGSTLVLDASMVATAARLGPGRFFGLVLLLGPRRLSMVPQYGWAAAALFVSLFLGGVYVTLASLLSDNLVSPLLPEELLQGKLRWLTFVVVVLIGPFVEEVFFRGFIFAGLLRRFGLPVALLASSMVFGIAHLDMATMGPAFFSGVAFALVYWRSGSLGPVILAHTAQNAIAFALSG